MAITLDILENESINLSVDEPEVMVLSVGETTVISENDYSNLINKPSIEGTELDGDVSLNDLHGYTQEQINTLLSGKADTEDIPSLEGYATEQWVGQQGYLTEHQSLAGYVPTSRKINGNALAADITLSIPTKTSDLTNDSGFITLADLPIYNGGVQ